MNIPGKSEAQFGENCPQSRHVLNQGVVGTWKGGKPAQTFGRHCPEYRPHLLRRSFFKCGYSIDPDPSTSAKAQEEGITFVTISQKKRDVAILCASIRVRSQFDYPDSKKLLQPP